MLTVLERVWDGVSLFFLAHIVFVASKLVAPGIYVLFFNSEVSLAAAGISLAFFLPCFGTAFHSLASASGWSLSALLLVLLTFE